jgi:DNA-binding response OmpR family regulator
MAPTIAFVDDEADLREAVAEFLTDRGLRVLTAASAAEFRNLAASEPIDIAVLDIAMAGEDGLSLGRWLVSQGTRPGLIFATAAGESIDRIGGLESGADDYIVKPYELRELLARIRSVLRRLFKDRRPIPQPSEAAPSQRSPRAIRIGSVRLDRGTCRLIRDDGEVQLTPFEADLLAVLASRPHRVLSRRQLLSLAGEGDNEEAERSIDSRVARLRRKLSSAGVSPASVQNVRGEGYMFAPKEA